MWWPGYTGGNYYDQAYKSIALNVLHLYTSPTDPTVVASTGTNAACDPSMIWHTFDISAGMDGR